MKTYVHCGSPLYCDIGPYEGRTRVDFRGSVYMSPEEAQQYYKNGLEVAIPQDDPGQEPPKEAEGANPTNA